MTVINELLANQVFMTSLISWLIAQVIKTIIDFSISGSLNLERMTGAGGMPSCHSATVCSMATVCFLIYGPGSFEFAISTMVAIIVMYDARGVRRETGNQAVIINKITDYLSHLGMENNPVPEFSEDNLKELVGHTPLQVFFGALLGIVLALISHTFIYGG